jgi:glycosyltransferase involved in cell wall biosynthesis
LRLTILNQFYLPDLAPTGFVAASLAEHRAELGDDVTVIASRGGYVGTPSEFGQQASENPRVIRLWTPSLGKTHALKRIIDYAIFYFSAVVRMAALPRQEVIVSLTTPPFIAFAAVLHKLLHPSTRIILWSMDCYPEVIERAGLLQETSLPSRLMRWLNSRLFRQLDHLVCLDRAMMKLLTAQYVDEAHPLDASIIPNWENASQFPPYIEPPIWDKTNELDLNDSFVILYLGNVGFGHRFETVVAAAKQLKDQQVVFLFIGGGEQWSWLENAKVENELDNLLLYPYIPKEQTPSVMAFSHCALITLHEDFAGVISPSKLHSNLAMSLPIVYVGPQDSNVDDAIRRFNFGVSLRHGEVDRLIQFIYSLRDQPDLLEEYQKNARTAFEKAYTDVQNLPLFDDIIKNLGPSS